MQKRYGFRKMNAARKTGSAGALICRKGSGGQFGKIILRMAPLGIIFRMIMLEAAFIDGVRTDYLELQTGNAGSVLL
jgi:hypothetical protein